MFTSRSFARKFGRKRPWGGRGERPLWPWRAALYAILGLAASMVLCAAIYFLSSLWKVSDVAVQGTVRYDPETILSVVDIESGDRMIDFDGWAVEDQLKEEFPLLKSVKLKRRLNGQVVLRVTEVEELYYTCHHVNYYLISAKDMTVLDVSTSPAEYQSFGAVYLGFPEEARVRVGEKVSYVYLPYAPVNPPEELATYEVVTDEPDEEYSYVQAFIQAVNETSMADRVTGMELGDRYDLYLILDGRVKICFGSMNELSRKLTQAVNILALHTEESTLPAVLDVSDPSRSTYREDAGLILPDWALLK